MGIYQLIFPVFAVCFSLCCAPIQTAISKFCAEDKQAHPDNAIRYYRMGLLISLLLSGICSSFVYFFSDEIAHYFLLEDRCSHLLKILSLTIPCNAIHSCICGYYYGKQKTLVPAMAQLFEQISRMLFVWGLAVALSSRNQTFNLTGAVFALAVGEIVSMIFTIIAVRINIFKIRNTAKKQISALLPKRQIIQNLLTMAAPLTASRLTLSMLQSIEATMIPSRLQIFGLSSEQAFSIYGIFSGMALPFILFPSTLTNSFAVVLLPDIAKAQADDQYNHISNMSNKVRDYCLYLGILCTGLFIILGSDIGSLFFANRTAGEYIAALSWICPFLYLTTTFSSILNGLGKTTTTFIQQFIGLFLRLFFVLLCIPVCGIFGYFLGLLISQLVTCGLHYISLKRILTLEIDALYALIRPMAAISLAIIAEKVVISHLTMIDSALLLLMIAGLLITCIYFAILYFTK